jgi:Helix-turn-helix of DDE superfamily endonuclease
MRFDSVKELKGEAFRRLTGVQRSTFDAMSTLLFAAKRQQKAAGGKPNTLCIEDQLLMMLEYWREYRTYFQSGKPMESAKARPTATSNGAKTRWPKANLFVYRAARPLLQTSGSISS